MLRGIAALIVVISHYSNATNLLNGALGGGAGQFGVMLFFILSGFLMSYLYMNQEFNKNAVHGFLIARVARVLPLFLVVVLCSYSLSLVELKGILYNIPNTASLVSHLALLSGTSVLWTIPAEMQFYALFVLLWWLLSKKEGYLYIVFLLVFFLLIFLNSPHPKGRIFGVPFDLSLIPALPYFFSGVVLGRLYRVWQSPGYLSSGVFTLTLLFLLFLYPRIFFSLVGSHHGMWQDSRILFALSFIFFSIVFFVPDHNRVLSNHVGDFLGKISYSLYLLHLPVLFQLKKAAVERPELFLAVFLMTSIGISYLSYLIIEDPLRRAIRSTALLKRSQADTQFASLPVQR